MRYLLAKKKSSFIPVLLAGLLILIFVFIFIPDILAQTDQFGLGYVAPTGLGSKDIRQTIAEIIRVALGLLGIVVVVIIIYGAVIYMTAGGNEEKVTKAKKILGYGAIGLVIILASVAIATWVINSISEATCYGCPGPGPGPSCDYDGTCEAGESSTCPDCWEPTSTACREKDNTPLEIEPKICEVQSCGEGKFLAQEDGTAYPGKTTAEGSLGAVVYIYGREFGDWDARDKVSLVDNSTTPATEIALEVTTCGNASQMNWSDKKIVAKIPAGAVLELNKIYQVSVFNGPALKVNDPSKVVNFKIISCDLGPQIYCLIPDYGETEIEGRYNPSTYFDIYGENFNTDLGEITFHKPKNELQPLSPQAELGGGGDWTDSLISEVKIPTLEDKSTGIYGVRVKTLDNKKSQPAEFSIQCSQNSQCATGCCKSPQCRPASQCGVGPGEPCGTVQNGGCDNAQTCWDGSTCLAENGCKCPSRPGDKCGDYINGSCSIINSCSGGTTCSVIVGNECRCPQPPEAPVIDDFGPKDGAEDTFVTIIGRNFGDAKGSVKLVYKDGGHEYQANAPVACEGLTTWTDDQVIISIPAMQLEANPARGDQYIIELTTANDQIADTRNLKKDDQIQYFIYNYTLRPGLCEISPDRGFASDQVTAYGTSYGNMDWTKIYLGAFENDISFINKGIENFGNPDWLKAQVPDTEAKEWWTALWTYDLNSGKWINSNPVRFTVFKENDYVKITGVTPEAGPIGTYVTITGQGFRSTKGISNIKFNDLNADISFPSECAGAVWRDNQMIVKVPLNAPKEVNSLNLEIYYPSTEMSNNDCTAKNGTPEYSLENTYIYCKFLANWPGGFEVTDDPLKPGLCQVDPTSGIWGTPFTLYGENFGAQEDKKVGLGTKKDIEPKAESWQEGSGQTADRVSALVPENQSLGKQPLYLAKGGQQVSNSLDFTVGDCRKGEVTCTTGTICCSDGSCKTQCESEAVPCDYAWTFKTGQANPRVINKAPYSASDRAFEPSTAIVAAVFDQPINPDTLKTGTGPNTIQIIKCESYTNGSCVNSGDASYLSGNIELFNDKGDVASTSVVGFRLLERVGNSAYSSIEFAEDTYYQITLTTGIKSILDYPLASEESERKWTFRTGKFGVGCCTVGEIGNPQDANVCGATQVVCEQTQSCPPGRGQFKGCGTGDNANDACCPADHICVNDYCYLFKAPDDLTGKVNPNDPKHSVVLNWTNLTASDLISQMQVLRYNAVITNGGTGSQSCGDVTRDSMMCVDTRQKIDSLNCSFLNGIYENAWGGVCIPAGDTNAKICEYLGWQWDRNTGKCTITSCPGFVNSGYCYPAVDKTQILCQNAGWNWDPRNNSCIDNYGRKIAEVTCLDENFYWINKGGEENCYLSIGQDEKLCNFAEGAEGGGEWIGGKCYYNQLTKNTPYEYQLKLTSATRNGQTKEATSNKAGVTTGNCDQDADCLGKKDSQGNPFLCCVVSEGRCSIDPVECAQAAVCSNDCYYDSGTYRKANGDICTRGIDSACTDQDKPCCNGQSCVEKIYSNDTVRCNVPRRVSNAVPFTVLAQTGGCKACLTGLYPGNQTIRRRVDLTGTDLLQTNDVYYSASSGANLAGYGYPVKASEDTDRTIPYPYTSATNINGSLIPKEGQNLAGFRSWGRVYAGNYDNDPDTTDCYSNPLGLNIIQPASPNVVIDGICDFNTNHFPSPNPFPESINACNALGGIYVEFNRLLDSINLIKGTNIIIESCSQSDPKNCTTWTDENNNFRLVDGSATDDEAYGFVRSTYNGSTHTCSISNMQSCLNSGGDWTDGTPGSCRYNTPDSCEKNGGSWESACTITAGYIQTNKAYNEYACENRINQIYLLPNGTLAAGSWYRITLKGFADNRDTPIRSIEGRPMLNTYSWKFKVTSGGDSCKVERVFVYPSPQTITSLAALNNTADYYAKAYNKYCQVLQANFGWSPSDPAASVAPEQTTYPNNKTTATALAEKEEGLDIKATETVSSKVGLGRLIIDLPNFYVTRHYPDCDSNVCTNTVVWSEFSRAIDRNTLNPQNVGLYRCTETTTTNYGQMPSTFSCSSASGSPTNDCSQFGAYKYCVDYSGTKTCSKSLGAHPDNYSCSTDNDCSSTVCPKCNVNSTNNYNKCIEGKCSKVQALISNRCNSDEDCREYGEWTICHNYGTEASPYKRCSKLTGTSTSITLCGNNLLTSIADRSIRNSGQKLLFDSRDFSDLTSNTKYWFVINDGDTGLKSVERETLSQLNIKFESNSIDINCGNNCNAYGWGFETGGTKCEIDFLKAIPEEKTAWLEVDGPNPITYRAEGYSDFKCNGHPQQITIDQPDEVHWYVYDKDNIDPRFAGCPGNYPPDNWLVTDNRTVKPNKPTELSCSNWESYGFNEGESVQTWFYNIGESYIYNTYGIDSAIFNRVRPGKGHLRVGDCQTDLDCKLYLFDKRIQCPESRCVNHMCTPDITSVNPLTGAHGSWITVRGCYFRDEPGFLIFDEACGDYHYCGFSYEKLPVICGDTWTDTRVIAEVTKNSGYDVPGPLELYTSLTSPSFTGICADNPSLCIDFYDNSKLCSEPLNCRFNGEYCCAHEPLIFTPDDSEDHPGLCKLEPEEGGLVNSQFAAIGTGFGGSKDKIGFNKEGWIQGQWGDFPQCIEQDANLANASWGNQQIGVVDNDGNVTSGPSVPNTFCALESYSWDMVRVYNDGKASNPLDFDVKYDVTITGYPQGKACPNTLIWGQSSMPLDDKTVTQQNILLGACQEKGNCSLGSYKSFVIGSPSFYGSGKNDLTTSGIFTGTSAINYLIQITGQDPDKFKWSDNGGETWSLLDVEISGSSQTLSSNGVQITFGNTTGHQIGDMWVFSVSRIESYLSYDILENKFIIEPKAWLDFNRKYAVIVTNDVKTTYGFGIGEGSSLLNAKVTRGPNGEIIEFVKPCSSGCVANAYAWDFTTFDVTHAADCTIGQLIIDPASYLIQKPHYAKDFTVSAKAINGSDIGTASMSLNFSLTGETEYFETLRYFENPSPCTGDCSSSADSYGGSSHCTCSCTNNQCSVTGVSSPGARVQAKNQNADAYLNVSTGDYYVQEDTNPTQAGIQPRECVDDSKCTVSPYNTCAEGICVATAREVMPQSCDASHLCTVGTCLNGFCAEIGATPTTDCNNNNANCPSSYPYCLTTICNRLVARDPANTSCANTCPIDYPQCIDGKCAKVEAFPTDCTQSACPSDYSYCDADKKCHKILGRYQTFRTCNADADCNTAYGYSHCVSSSTGNGEKYCSFYPEVSATAYVTAFMCENPWVFEDYYLDGTDYRKPADDIGVPLENAKKQATNFEVSYCRDNTNLPNFYNEGLYTTGYQVPEDSYKKFLYSFRQPDSQRELVVGFKGTEYVTKQLGTEIVNQDLSDKNIFGINKGGVLGKAVFYYSFGITRPPERGDYYYLEVKLQNLPYDQSGNYYPNAVSQLWGKGVQHNIHFLVSRETPLPKFLANETLDLPVLGNEQIAYIPLGECDQGNCEPGSYKISLDWLNDIGDQTALGIKEVNVYSGKLNEGAVIMDIKQNDQYQSLKSWYDANKATYGYSGDIQILGKVDGYEYGKASNAYYVMASNICDTSGSDGTCDGNDIYYNVYIFSSDGSATSNQIVDQMVLGRANMNDGIKFNVNLKPIPCVNGACTVAPYDSCFEGRCISVAESSTISCTSKADCPAPYDACLVAVCITIGQDSQPSAIKPKLVRDYQRIQDFNAFSQLLANTSDHPSLASGSFIPGYSNSKWNSWTDALASDFGTSLPTDPLNQWSVTCSSNDPNNVYYDPETCFVQNPPNQCLNNNPNAILEDQNGCLKGGTSTCPQFCCPRQSHVYNYFYQGNLGWFYGNLEFFGPTNLNRTEGIEWQISELHTVTGIYPNMLSASPLYCWANILADKEQGVVTY